MGEIAAVLRKCSSRTLDVDARLAQSQQPVNVTSNPTETPKVVA